MEIMLLKSEQSDFKRQRLLDNDNNGEDSQRRQGLWLGGMATSVKGYGAILKSVYALETAVCVPFVDCRVVLEEMLCSVQMKHHQKEEQMDKSGAFLPSPLCISFLRCLRLLKNNWRKRKLCVRRYWLVYPWRKEA